MKRNAIERKIMSNWNSYKGGLKHNVGENCANDWNDLAVSYQQLIELQYPIKIPKSTNQYNPFLFSLGIQTQSLSNKNNICFKQCA